MRKVMNVQFQKVLSQVNITQFKMNSRVKSFIDIPSFYKNSPCFTTESAEVLFYEESSSNIETEDTKSEHGGEGKNLDSQKRCYYKSLLFVIKRLKSFSVRLQSKGDNETQHTIYRQLRTPKEYIYVRGMSGLSKRVEKLPSSSCNRCVTRFG
jgi:hypothetical protein